MAVPKQHDSKSKVGKRRSQKNLKKQNLQVCYKCKSPKLSHRACPNCGAYKSPSKKQQKPEMKKEDASEDQKPDLKKNESTEEENQEKEDN